MRSALLRPSMATVAVVAVASLVWLARPAIPLIDGDVWWHIRGGEEVLRTGAVPMTDTWSIVGQGMRWVSQDWLSNVALASVFGAGGPGPTVLSIAFSGFVLLSLLVLWRAIGVRHPTTGWLSRLVWLTAGLTAAGPVLGVRVQVVDLPLAAASLLVLWRATVGRGLGSLAWLPIIAVVWANVHAGWLILFLFGGAIVVGHGLDRLLSRELGTPALPWPTLGWITGALAVSAFAIVLNPNGSALYLYPLETSSIPAHRDFLAEWSPPDVGTVTGQLFAAFVVLGVVPTFIVGWRRMPLSDGLLLGGVTIMAAMAARFLLIAGPVGGTIIAIHLAPVISRSRIGRAAGKTLRRMAETPTGTRAPANLVLAATLALLGVAVTMLRVGPEAQRAAIAQHMPVAAVDWIVANDAGARPFNTYSWGGYLGWRRPDTLVFIDGRSDIYGDEPIRAYADAISLRSDPEELLEGNRVDHVLFNTDHPFAEWLNRHPDWTRAYSDPLASVWLRVEENRR